MVGDTRITHGVGRATSRIEPRTRLLEGALKVVVLAPTLCVGYAGSVPVAQTALRQLAVPLAHLRLEDVKESLRRPSVDGASFIIGSLAPLPALVTVEDGQVVEGGDRRYIGHTAAYNLFHHALQGIGGHGLSARGPDGLLHALRLVLEQGAVASAVEGTSAAIRNVAYTITTARVLRSAATTGERLSG